MSSDISLNTRTSLYTATSGQTIFDYDFTLYDEGDIRVYINDELLESTDYQVDGILQEDGGTITLNQPASDGDNISLIGFMQPVRLVQYQKRGAIYSHILNHDLNKIFAMSQELRREMDSAIRVSASTGIFNATISGLAPGSTLIVNNAGDGFASGPDAGAIANAEALAEQAEANILAANAALAATTGLQASYQEVASRMNILESLVDDLATKVTKPGTKVNFGMLTIPEGYLLCDGSEISRAEYPDLFAAIGTTYGAGDGATTFNLPDDRGEFIRGYDHGRGVDQGRVFGSHQMDEFKEHSHSGGTNSLQNYIGGNRGAYVRLNTQGIPPTGTTGGDETRPRNNVVNICIKT